MDDIHTQGTQGAPVELPNWLTVSEEIALPKPSKERQALAISQFETALARTLELVSAGYTLTDALRSYPFEIDIGAFMRWLRRDPARYELYKEAKEIRTEAWAGKLVEYAEANGVNSLEDVQRSKLKIDTLKWLMASDNRRTYGDVKQIDVGGSISITAALAQANQRVLESVIDAELLDLTAAHTAVTDQSDRPSQDNEEE